MNEKKIIEVIEFTDPVCTWCWGSEPMLRKLETVYKDNIKVSFVMGGLVRDIREFNDPANGIGGDPIQANKNIALHWEEASKHHGMPVNAEDFNLFSDEYPSSYPQNIAYCAARMEDEELANRYLRLLREETIVFGRQTNRKAVLIELANDIGLDIVQFIERLDDGSAEAAFNHDLNFIRAYRVMGFPTFLVRYGDNELLLRGYQSFQRMQAVINSMTDGEIQPQEVEVNEQEIIAFVSKYLRVALVEIQAAFNITKEVAEEYVNQLFEKKIFKKNVIGNGYFIEINDKLVCDPITGICTSI